MTEQEPAAAPPSSELLLEVARVEFDQVAHQSDSIEAKARTYLTINSLMLTAGVLAVTRGGLPPEAPHAIKIVTIILLVILVTLLGVSYAGLLGVLSVRTTKGVPSSRSVLENCSTDSEEALRGKLSRYYSKRAGENAAVVSAMADSLERSTSFTRYSLTVFFAFVITMLIALSTPLEPAVTASIVQPAFDGGGSGDPPPPPDDIEETTVKKGGTKK